MVIIANMAMEVDAPPMEKGADKVKLLYPIRLITRLLAIML